MKFNKLYLERYGVFSDIELDFDGGGANLHIIYGENEAGKSTVLSAIADLLFGIPKQTSYNFRHDYPKLRIGAEIMNKAGKRLAFKRRKANTGTLLTMGPTETTLSDAILKPFLGGTSRELFTRMFGLDHKRLRIGGEEMLDVKGDIARTLFEAGSGLAGIGGVLRNLETEIDEIGDLFKRRAKTKPLWREMEIFEEASKSVRRDRLKADEWLEAETALQHAQIERGRLDDGLQNLRKRRLQLDRIRRVAPRLAAMDAFQAQLAEYGDLPPFPVGFADEWRRHEENLRDARTTHQRANEALDQRNHELERAPKAGKIIEFADQIEALQEHLGKYRAALSDEPRLDRYIAEDDAFIHEQLLSLRISVKQTSVGELLPPVTLRAKINDLIKQGERVDITAQSAAHDVEKRREVLRSAEEKLAAHPAVKDPAQAILLLDEVSQLGDLGAQAVKAQRDRSNADRDLAESADSGLNAPTVPR